MLAWQPTVRRIRKKVYNKTLQENSTNQTDEKSIVTLNDTVSQEKTTSSKENPNINNTISKKEDFYERPASYPNRFFATQSQKKRKNLCFESIHFHLW